MKTSLRSIFAWIDKLDPGHLALKRSFKTFLAILISMTIFRETPGMAMFSAITSMLFSRSQAGFTIQERRFTMLTTGAVMTILSVPVALISQNQWTALAFVVLASFVVFFLIGNRIVPDFPAVSILALSVVEMAFAYDFESGLSFTGLFVLNLTLVYTLHFILWPTRPRKRMKTQIEIITKNMVEYRSAIITGYPDPESGMQATQDLSDKVRQSIGDFRRLWELFGFDTKTKSTTENRYLDIYAGLEKIYEYLILLWQFRVTVWESGIFKNKILQNDQFESALQYLIHRHNPSIIKPSDLKLNKQKVIIREMFDKNLETIKKQYTPATHAEWVAVINALKALETLLADIEHPADQHSNVVQAFSVKSKLRSFIRSTQLSLHNFKPANAAFKLGVRSTLIIGGTMAWSLFLEPNYGYWLVLFAVLLIRPNLGISIKVGKERVIGTVAGSLLALGFVSVVPSGSIFYFAFLLLNAFLMLWFININRMIPMVTFMTMLIIGIFYLLYPDDGNLVWLRILYTAAIVLFVIVASFLIWPEKARNRFALTLAGALELEKQFFTKTMGSFYESGSPKVSVLEKQEIRNQIQQLNDTIEATKNEILQENVIVHGLNIRSYIMRMLNTLQTMDSITRDCVLSKKNENFYIELKAFSTSIQRAFNDLISALQTPSNVNDFPDLRSDFEKLRTTFRAIKYGHGEVSESISQLWQNSTLIWIFKPLILELEGIKTEINLKMREM